MAAGGEGRGEERRGRRPGAGPGALHHRCIKPGGFPWRLAARTGPRGQGTETSREPKATWPLAVLLPAAIVPLLGRPAGRPCAANISLLGTSSGRPCLLIRGLLAMQWLLQAAEIRLPARHWLDRRQDPVPPGSSTASCSISPQATGSRQGLGPLCSRVVARGEFLWSWAEEQGAEFLGASRCNKPELVTGP